MTAELSRWLRAYAGEHTAATVDAPLDYLADVRARLNEAADRIEAADADRAVLDAADAEVTAKDAALAMRCAKGTGDAWTAAEDAREAAVRARRETQ